MGRSSAGKTRSIVAQEWSESTWREELSLSLSGDCYGSASKAARLSAAMSAELREIQPLTSSCAHDTACRPVERAPAPGAGGRPRGGVAGRAAGTGCNYTPKNWH